MKSYGCDGDVTGVLPALSYPTRFYQRAHPIYIYINVTDVANSEEPS